MGSYRHICLAFMLHKERVNLDILALLSCCIQNERIKTTLPRFSFAYRMSKPRFHINWNLSTGNMIDSSGNASRGGENHATSGLFEYKK